MSLSNLFIPNGYDLYCGSLNFQEGNSLDIYSSNDLTVIMTYEDGTTDSYDCKIQRIGNLVNFYFPYNENTNGPIVYPNRFIENGQIPQIYRPITGTDSGTDFVQYGLAYSSIDDSRAFGVFDIKNNGAFDLYSSEQLEAPVEGQKVSFFPMTYSWYIA